MTRSKRTRNNLMVAPDQLVASRDNLTAERGALRTAYDQLGAERDAMLLWRSFSRAVRTLPTTGGEPSPDCDQGLPRFLL